MNILFSYQDGDFSLTHSRTEQPDPSTFRMHTHPKIELLYFEKGRGIFRAEGNEYSLESGDLLVLQPAESHYITPSSKHLYERKVLHFSADTLHAVDPDGQLLRCVFNRKPGRSNLYRAKDFTGGSCAPFFDRMLSSFGDTRVNIFAGLIPLLAEMSQIQQTRAEDLQNDTQISRIIRYINNNLEKPLSLDGLCETFYLSKPQLCRLFKSATGTTAWQYITTKRLIRAVQKIEAGEKPTSVYAQCGFSDYSNFYRAYIKHFGHAPSEHL